MVTLFLYGKSKDFFLEGDIRNIPDCPGRNNSQFALENEGWNMSLVFSTQLMSTRPHMQEAPARFKTIGEGHFVWCVVFLQCSEIESDCFQIFQSQFRNPQILPFNFLSCSACWSKKQDAGMETSHAKRIFSDNVTCFGKNKSCSNRSHLSGCFKCSSLLACKAPRAQLSICFPTSLSHIHLTASLLCPADCF